MKRIWICLPVLLLFAAATSAAELPAQLQEVEKVFGRKGTAQGNMLKITFPRSDLSVRRGEVPVDAGLALTGWIAFKQMGKESMMMGDLVLTEAEVPRMMKRLTDQNIKITALHNHLLATTPVTMYLHFSAEGNATRLARAMKEALSVTGTPLEPPAAPPASAGPDWSNVEKILGKSGTKKGQLIQFGFPRQEKIKESGMEIPPFMGTGTGINLRMEGDRATTSGDFVLIAAEVNPVVKALVEHGLEVTAVHNHMLRESPRLFFLHFWGYDDPAALARGLRAALDQTSSRPRR